MDDFINVVPHSKKSLVLAALLICTIHQFFRNFPVDSSKFKATLIFELRMSTALHIALQSICIVTNRT